MTEADNGCIAAHSAQKLRTLWYDEGNYSIWYALPTCHLIVDYFGYGSVTQELFEYRLYTTFQNTVVSQGLPVYRFLAEDVANEAGSWIDRLIEFPSTYTSTQDRSLSVADSSLLEDFFEERFCEVYGKNARMFLVREYPIPSLHGSTYSLDYVVEYIDGSRVAVEENGIAYHHPQLIGKDRYRKQLEKQNICSLLGIRLYRFTTLDCSHPQLVDDQIRHFFGEKYQFRPAGLKVDRSYQLYEHQVDTIEGIRKMRESVPAPHALLTVLPTATGKSRIVEEDLVLYLAEHPQAKVLIVGPTHRVCMDWLNRMHALFEFEPISIGTNLSDQIVVGTYHLLWRASSLMDPKAFSYLVVDEAHHAVAPVIRRSLQYFEPDFLIGLTATPQRLDQKRLEEVFGTYRSPLDLKQAIDQGIVANVRAYRIETNLNLSEVRFNGRDYLNADLERTLVVDSRNRLIADVLKRYFTDGQKGLVFCVNVEHTKQLAALLGEAGLSARAVDGKTCDIDAVVKEFRFGSLQFLCSCNLLTEGWDVPEVEVLVMARPTISKVLYVQQLGRGLRKTTKKQDLFVIDVVDQYGYLARPWCAHALFGMPFYTPFGLISKAYQEGDVVQVLGLSETVRALVPIDIFTFEQTYEGYLDEDQTARELYIGTQTLRTWVQKGSVHSDLSLRLGSRTIYYFHPESLAKIRETKQLGLHTDETLKEDFLSFVREKNYTYSFKMVFLKGLLSLMNQHGEARLDDMLESYRSFYIHRLDVGLPVDRPGCIYSRGFLADTPALKRNMLANPFEKFERKRFVQYVKDLGLIALNPLLFQALSSQEIKEVIALINQHLQEYYQDLGGLPNA
ncbi:MAG: DEAD/DEAH box helicase [Sphaerochaeta sp.]|uniref:DEAD/DEAH box helicase n=1 Tax=Sphaerochaeta sp. TaxID=1972642 RepID=UPI003D121208